MSQLVTAGLYHSTTICPPFWWTETSTVSHSHSSVCLLPDYTMLWVFFFPITTYLWLQSSMMRVCLCFWLHLFGSHSGGKSNSWRSLTKHNSRRMISQWIKLIGGSKELHSNIICVMPRLCICLCQNLWYMQQWVRCALLQLQTGPYTNTHTQTQKRERERCICNYEHRSPYQMTIVLGYSSEKI